jgi:ribosomal protein S9
LTGRAAVRLAVFAAALALAAATAFGLWHVVVGGGLRGNARAAEFGVVLAVVAGSLLAALAVGVRRLGILSR